MGNLYSFARVTVVTFFWVEVETRRYRFFTPTFGHCQSKCSDEVQCKATVRMQEGGTCIAVGGRTGLLCNLNKTVK